MSKRVSLVDKKKVRERARGYCEYCMSQEYYASQAFTIDHIIPLILGGLNELLNLCLCCQGCNNFKYTKIKSIDPKTQKMVQLFNPRTNSWKDHFKWNENHTVIIGITKTGRSTVEALKLNRTYLLNQRVLYIAHGIHPPSHTV
ncbi:MAG TPA: HNH endonuclease [Bacteroidetes bacterium]|nr:HNH endonuclease [Bacteroidota bacterium]